MEPKIATTLLALPNSNSKQKILAKMLKKAGLDYSESYQNGQLSFVIKFNGTEEDIAELAAELEDFAEVSRCDSEMTIDAAIDNNNQPELATQVEEKPSPDFTTITIERTDEKMTIAMPAIGATEKKKSYFVDGVKMSKGMTEIVIHSYVQFAIETGATI